MNAAGQGDANRVVVAWIKRFGRTLHYRRGWQKRAAAALGISESYVGKILKHGQRPGVELLLKVQSLGGLVDVTTTPRLPIAMVDGTGSLRAKAYPVLRRCVEEGAAYGWGRAHKHTEQPVLEDAVEAIANAVMSEICDYFEIDRPDTER